MSRDGKESKRFARLSRVAGVVPLLLLLRAVLDGVLGSRSRNNKSSVASEVNQTTHPGIKTNKTDPSSSNNTHPEHVNILHGSNITVAVAFDESNDTIYRLVIFQDPTSAVIARVWDRRSSDWTTVNVSGNFDNSTPLNAVSHTPFARTAAYSVGQGALSVYMWFLHLDGSINSAR